MKNTTSFKRLVAACAVSVVAMLATGMAQADVVGADYTGVKCANPMVVVLGANGRPTNASQDRQYATTGASDCVWGTSTGNIGGGNDEFLAGDGINDAAYGVTGASVDGGSTFGLIWTRLDSKNANLDGNDEFVSLNSLTGLLIGDDTASIVGADNWIEDNNTFNWILTATGYDYYALGLKDGGDPKWAVFLLSDLSGIADITTSGSWSHIVLYGANDGGGGQTEIPEPGTLALVGLALLGGAALRRRKV